MNRFEPRDRAYCHHSECEDAQRAEWRVANDPLRLPFGRCNYPVPNPIYLVAAMGYESYSLYGAYSDAETASAIAAALQFEEYEHAMNNSESVYRDVYEELDWGEMTFEDFTDNVDQSPYSVVAISLDLP